MITTFIFTVVLLFVLFFTSKKYGKNVVYAYPLIALYLEFSRSLLIFDGLPPGFMGLTVLVYIFILINTGFSSKKFNGVVFLLVLFVTISLYYIVQTDYYTDGVVNGVSRVFRFLMIYAFFFIGYVSFNSLNELNELNKNIIRAAFIFILCLIIMALFQHGGPLYRGSMIYGITQGELHFAPLFVLISTLIFFINRYYNKISVDKLYLNILYVFMLVILGISLMRTTWVILAIGLLFIFYYANKKSKFTLKHLSIYTLSTTLLVLFIYLFDIYSIRASTYSSTYEFEDEGRFRELFVINNYYLNDLTSRLFGTGKLFGPLYTFGFWNYDYRTIHGTYTRIYHGTGLIGVALYLLFLLTILTKMVSVRVSGKLYSKKLLRVLKGGGIGMILGYMFAAISGAITSPVYPPLVFLYIGAVYRILKSDNEYDKN